MAQQHLRVLLGFGREDDNQLVATTGAILTGMTGNKAFPAPPVDLAALQAALTDFAAAIAARPQGGTTATADKNKKRHALVTLLRRLASYVQASSQDDRTTLLSSGFHAVGTIRTMSPLSKPVIVGVDNGHTTQLVVKANPVARARTYEVRSAAFGAGETPGPWQSAGLFTKAKSMTVTGLTPGTNYTFQVRAVGGSTGYSDWSDPVAHMAM